MFRKMKDLNTKLVSLNGQADEYEQAITKNLKELFGE